MTEFTGVEQSLAPPRPQHLLRAKLLDDMHLTQSELAKAIGISAPRLNMILKGRCQISPEVALRIERVFGIPAHFWASAVAEFELFEKRRRMSAELEKLSPLSTAKEVQVGRPHFRGTALTASAIEAHGRGF